MSTIPTVEETRKRIEKVDVKQIRLCLKIIYLTASRVSEMVGYSTPRDTSIARGPRGTDLSTATYNHYNKPIPTAIFHLKIAKRGGKPKLLALPLEKQYEPWTQELVDYFKSRGGEFVFPYSRQQIWAVARPAFEGLKYPIEKYKVFEDGKIIKEVDEHSRDFTTHALRHIRTTELIEVYGFDGFDLSIFCGWTMQTTVMGGSSMLSRYVSLQWRKYFPKLLIERVV